MNPLTEVVCNLEDRLNRLADKVRKLERDSHPPQPIVTANEFERYTARTKARLAEINGALARLEEAVAHIEQRLDAAGLGEINHDIPGGGDE